MQQSRSTLVLTRLVAYIVIIYGLLLVAGALLRQLRAHPGHHLDVLLVTVPQITGLGFTYLGTLLLRRKYNAWVAALVLYGISFVLDIVHLVVAPDRDNPSPILHLLLLVCIVVLLWLARSAFQVRSDVRSFTQAVRVSALVLLVAFAYGLGGFTLLDMRDFHQEISLPAAAQRTVDQFGLTANHPVAHTRRARLFLDSLSVISIAAVSYTAISLFDPTRMRLVNQTAARELAEQLLRRYPSDIDDYFKLWPHDKLYYFDKTRTAGLAYYVSRGVALVVGNPFGDAKHFRTLLQNFGELCFVNDWLPAFVHVDELYREAYEKQGLRLQKIGEEAVLDLAAFRAAQTGKTGKYYRQIRNRFDGLGYRVDVLQAPHAPELLARLRDISDDWLAKPGREERGFMLGYHNDVYLQSGAIAVVYDAQGTVQGFINVVPTYEPGVANYDLLRCASDAPGNCNDFLLLGLIDHLTTHNYTTLNLGLSPLAGLSEPAQVGETSLVHNALRFFYSNGDRLYSFAGLHRFKAKYKPVWQPRYIAYPGGVRNFTRILAALNRTMKVK